MRGGQRNLEAVGDCWKFVISVYILKRIKIVFFFDVVVIPDAISCLIILLYNIPCHLPLTSFPM